jgi:RNA polymerase sigma-70 factor (ECF subfamily)
VVLPPDVTLVARLRDGDDAAFVAVLDAWSGGMLRLARSFVHDDDVAAEVVQDTWVGVIEGLGGFEGRSSLKTWAYRILVNTAKRRGAREGRSIPWSNLAAGEEDGPTVDPRRFQRPGEPFPGHWREPPPPWPSPEQGTLAAEVRTHVDAAVTRLPDRQRIVITLRDIEGYSPDEVCTILEITAANQRVLLHRARAAVRAELEAHHIAGATEAPRATGGAP